MARKVYDKDSKELLRIEFTATEMAENVLGVEVEDLIQWTERIPVERGQGLEAIYAVKDVSEMNLLKKRAALLRTRMSQPAVKNVEAAGLLDAYAALAEDCPPGVTAHVWRSYGVVVLMQTRYGKMIGPEQLATQARLVKPGGKKKDVDIEMAEKHLRLLQALNLLRANREEGRWEHQGLPKSWRGA
jgi:hypothetical protein